MKFLVMPLVVLIIVGALVQLGASADLTYETNEAVDEDYVATEDGWYDVDGHMVADKFESTQGIGEDGGLQLSGGKAFWLNESNVGVGGWRDLEMIEAAGSSVYDYPVFDLLNGTSLQERSAFYQRLNFNSFGSYGVIAVIIGVMALAAVIGLKIFGSGISDTSVGVLVKGTVFLSLWAVFSIASYDAIVSIPVFGTFAYFMLTAMYTFGILESIVGGGGYD